MNGAPTLPPDTSLPSTDSSQKHVTVAESTAVSEFEPAQLTNHLMETPRTRCRLKVFFDGGCCPNPGRIEAAVVVRGVPHLFDDLGHGTNSDAEWLALICALESTQSLCLTDIELIGDALEVIQQAQRALIPTCAGPDLRGGFPRG